MTALDMPEAPARTARILVVDDERPMRFFITELLHKEGYETEEACNGMEAVEKIESDDFDVVIIDHTMPVMTGIETIPRILTLRPEMIILMVTAHGSNDLAMDAVNLGALDYFTKPFDADEMRIVLKRALEVRRLRTEVRDLSRQLDDRYCFENIIGSSSVMREVFDIIERVASSDITCLIHGQSGTGKELVAKAVHARSPRKQKPFVALNCASIPEALLESELFGYEKGAFTGAANRRAGKFEQAQGGTLFLDEIGDMDLNLQSKILRALQEKELVRVGGAAPIQFDVRIVAATNKDLSKAVANGEFREDLFFRLNVVPIYMPPLHQRLGDIPLLVEHFLHMAGKKSPRQIRGVSEEVMDAFNRYHWPGNVRELENIIQRSVVLAKSDIITMADLPLEIRSERTETAPSGNNGSAPATVPTNGNGSAPAVPEAESEDGVSLLNHTKNLQEQAEKDMILKALEANRWKRGVAAEALGISRRSLLRKMKKYEIDG